MAITKIEIESKFIVTQGFDGGANTTVTLGNPRLTSLKPVLSADYDKTNTHTIKITLPIGTASNVNDKKLIYCDIGNSGGKLICIEKPFSEDAKIDLLAKLEKQERLINSEGKCVDQENLNKLKKDIETSKKSRDQRSAFLARDGIDQNGLRAIMPLSKPKQPGADGKTGESKIKPTASEKLKVALDEKRKVLKRKFKDYLEYLRERKTVPSSKIDRLGTSFKLKIERYSANSIERLSKRLDELKEIGN
ncbi:MAG: hypothetical protein HOG95_14880 [Rhodospirillaceae bacterium]|nr:hypothetical protein [Rhodospirillaceae bacterium]